MQIQKTQPAKSFISLLTCLVGIFVSHSSRAADPFTNFWVSGIDSIYWDGQNVKAVTLPISPWSGAPGYAQVSGDPNNYTLWFNASASAGISTNPGPTAVSSTEEAAPSVAIKANYVVAIDQHAGDTEWNGNGDLPRWARVRYSDAGAGETYLSQQEWRDGTVWTYYGNYNLTGDWNRITDKYSINTGRIITTNSSNIGSFSPAMTSEVCSNFFYYTLNYQGNTNNVWHFDFLGLALPRFGGQMAGECIETWAF